MESSDQQHPRKAISVVVLVVIFSLVGSVSVAFASEEDAPPPMEDVPGPIGDETLEEVDAYLERTLSAEGRPGLTAAIVQGDEIIHTVALGEARPGVPATADAPFLIASVTKSLTATALMTLVEDGIVGLDDPVGAYVPELGLPADQVTLADLMTHRSGLTTYVGNERWASDPSAGLEEGLEEIGAQLESPSPPYQYSNTNYDLLALVTERASGQPFADYLDARVLEPLDMDDTFTGLPEDGMAVAQGHYRWLLLGYRPFDQPAPLGLAGSAATYSTSEDLARFLIAHLNGGAYEGNRVLSAESIEELHRPRDIGIDLPDDYPVDFGYAGGLVVDASFRLDQGEDLASMVTLRHDGGAHSYRSVIWMMPEAKLGFVVITNGNDQSDQTWLPQVAQGVKHVVFGLEPLEIVNGAALPQRYGKGALALLVIIQLALAALTIRAMRGHGSRRSNIAIFTAATVVDLVALATVFWVIPAVGENPLPVVLQAPDYRILVVLLSIGVLWGVYRTYFWLSKRPGKQPA